MASQRYTADGKAIPDSYHGRIENYNPDFKKSAAATQRYTADGKAIPASYRGKIENYNPDFRKSTAPATDENKYEVSLIEPVEPIEPESDYFETEYGIVKITSTNFIVGESDIDHAFIKHFVAHNTIHANEDLVALLFYLGENHGFYKYYYLGEEPVFFTTDKEVTKFIFDNDEEVFVASSDTHKIWLPDLSKSAL